jgi:methionyl-tRNA synthetase
MNMLHRYFDGVLPAVTQELGAGSLPQLNFTVHANSVVLDYQRCFDSYDFSGGLDAVWRLISETNRYLGYTQPWAIADDPSKRDFLANILRTSAEALRYAAVLLHPVLPGATERLWKQLGLSDKLELRRQQIPMLGWNVLGDPARFGPDVRVGRPEPIFPRLDKEKSLAKLHELAEAGREPNLGALREAPLQENRERDKSKEKKPMDAEGAKTPSPESPAASPAAPVPSPQSPAPAVPEAAPKISIEDFAKVEMRVGQILTAEPVVGAQKLLKLTVDIGSEVRQVVAGIAEHYKPNNSLV